MNDSKRNGNVKHDPKPKPTGEGFEEGDRVAMTQEALKMGRLSAMSPRLLYQVGYPNEFGVLHSFETEEDGPCITLYPCCYVLEDRPRKTSRCSGHPAIFFEKIGEKPANKGDKRAKVHLPIIGEIAGVEWDEEHQRLSGHVGGYPVVFQGEIGRLVKKAAEEKGYF
jgi:hypothetical protein